MHDLMTAEEVADYLRISRPAFYQLKRRDVGPPVIRMGRRLRYRRVDVDQWLDEQQPAPAEVACPT